MGWHKVPHQIQPKVTRFPNLPCYFLITVPTRNTLKLDLLGFIYKGTVFQGEGWVNGCQYLRAGGSGAVTTQKLRGQGEGIVQNPEGKSYERGCHRKSNVLLWWDPDTLRWPCGVVARRMKTWPQFPPSLWSVASAPLAEPSWKPRSMGAHGCGPFRSTAQGQNRVQKAGGEVDLEHGRDDLIRHPHSLSIIMASFSHSLSILQGAVCTHTWTCVWLCFGKPDSRMARSTQAQMWIW